MRRQRAVLAIGAGVAAAVVVGAALVAASRSGAAAVTGPGPVAAPAPSASPAAAPQAVASSGNAGACPSGGLDWTETDFSAVPVDPANWEWLVQEHGRVRNDSPAAVVVGEGVGRIGRGTPPGQALSPVIDLALTPSGALTLPPGQAEPYGAAVLVQSADRPRDLGPGLSDASWASPAVASGCPAPGGAAPGPAAATSLD
ncbi:MAG TPA: hypothetical protein VFN68_09010 [Acidimicrobiales bacterium]|nr:hypothetical protein [Acidimicrobiales bacterium]